MAEKDKEETPIKDFETLQVKFAELEKTLLKREEDLAYEKRENEKLKTAKGERDTMVKDKAATGDGEAIKKLEKTLREEAAAREEALLGDLSKVKQQLKHERITSKAITKAAALFNEDALDLIQSKIERYCDEQDGEIFIKDDKGNQRYVGSKPMQVDDFLNELVEKHPSCAKAKGQPGAKQPGQKHEGGGNGTITGQDLLRMNQDQATKAVQTMNPQDAAKALNAIFNQR